MDLMKPFICCIFHSMMAMYASFTCRNGWLNVNIYMQKYANT
jgi:hypothetical protein